MIDAVLSYHLNPATCGVAKFNQLLAQKLGVPCLKLRSPQGRRSCHPLVSIKFAELTYPVTFSQEYELFVHDVPMSLGDWQRILQAQRIYAANPEIADKIRSYADAPRDVIEAFCPSTLQGNPTRGPLNVLTFGMAHKLQLQYYEKLKALLDGSGQDYTVSVSTAVHEGSPWDAVSEAGDKLRTIFGNKTRVLGYLADDALAKELQDCAAVAMFFDPALRANNTTFWAAYDAHATILTNLDGDSPKVTSDVHDINRLAEWTRLVAWRSINAALRDNHYTWDRLLQTLGVSA